MQSAQTTEIIVADAIFTENDKKPVKKQQGNWIEINGSLNKKPVYLVLEKVGHNQVAGYLFDGKGNGEYVYGEKINNSLQLYDQNNNRSTVIVFEQ